MASVGGYSVFSVKGPVAFSGMESILKSRPGVDGYDVQWIGVRGKPYTLLVRHDFISAGNMKAGKSSLYQLKGLLVDVADDFGNVANNHLVMDVTPKMEQKIFNAVGGFNSANGEDRYWLEVEMTLVQVD